MRHEALVAARNGGGFRLAVAHLVVFISGHSMADGVDANVRQGTVLRARERLVVDTWQVKDGLPQNSVTGLLQSRTGYIWAGTFDGLARFDGVVFKTFVGQDSAGHGGNRIISLAEDAKGGIWAGTENGGIEHLRISSFAPYPWPPGFPHGHVHRIQVSREGRLWFNLGNLLIQADDGVFTTYKGVGLESGAVDEQGRYWTAAVGGLTRLMDGSSTTYPWPESHQPKGSVALTAGGTVWAVTNRGVLRFRDGRFTRFTAPTKFPMGPVGPLVADAQGRVWGLSGRGSLFRIDGEKKFFPLTVWSLSTPAQARPSRGPAALSQTPSICEGKDGSLWLLGMDSIGCVRGDVLTEYDTPKDLTRNRGILSWFGDHEGSLWLGTEGSGLMRLHPSVVAAYGKEQGMIEEEAQCILEGRDGRFWVGTNGGGLALLAGDRFTVYRDRDGLPSNQVWSLLEDRQGTLWVGTWAGLARFAGGRFTRITPDDGRFLGAVLSIFEDRRGDLWMGTFGQGLHRMSHGKIETFTVKDGLASNFVRGIHEDGRGDLWFATDGGVSRLREGVFNSYTSKDGLSDNTVRAIHEDRDGTLWFGTYGNGLNRFKNGKFTPITTKNGLFDRNVSRILEDDQGRFWMSSNRGIYHIPRADLDAFVDGKLPSITCVSIGRAEGMKNPECNGGCQPAGWKAKDGLLWFPTAAGVVAVDPRRAVTNPVPPPVVVEKVLIDGRPVEMDGAPHQPPGRGDVEIGYTALSFLNPAKVRFKYRIEGFDRDWVEAGTRRVAYYTHIPPGSYRFRVIACNNDGVWNETGAAVRFTLRPHYYQTRWFFAVCGLAGLGVLFGAHRLVLMQLRARNAVLTERGRFAREIHDTMAQGLAGVVLQIRTSEATLLEQPETARTHLARARELVRDCLEEGRRAIHALRPGPLDQAQLPEAIRALGESLCKGTGMHFSFQVQGHPRPLAEDVEDDLWRIAQESMANAIRHSGGSCIRVTLHYERRRLILAVTDDGKGFPGEAAGSNGGHGLLGMRQRAQQRGWSLRMANRPDGGAEVRLDVPLRPWFYNRRV